MRLRALLAAASFSAALLWPASPTDPREIVRKCVDLDQTNWLRMKDYTWVAPGAFLVFEQTRVNDEVWLPKREFLSGSGKLALLKKVIEEQETTWSNYRKFQMESNIVSTR